MTSKVLFLTLMFIWPCHGNTSGMARIVGGKPANFANWTFTVAIYRVDLDTPNPFFSRYKYACTGVIINKWHVLTVAHCLRDLNNSNGIYILSGIPKIEFGFDVRLLDLKYFAKAGLHSGRTYRQPRKLMYVSHQLYYYLVFWNSPHVLQVGLSEKVGTPTTARVNLIKIG